ncbi:hypothetical protein, partial [Dysgonomonas macrotermitis]
SPVVAFVRSCLPFFILGGKPEGPEAKKSGSRRANRKGSQMIDLPFIHPGSQSFGSPTGRQEKQQAREPNEWTDNQQIHQPAGRPKYHSTSRMNNQLTGRQSRRLICRKENQLKGKPFSRLTG